MNMDRSAAVAYNEMNDDGDNNDGSCSLRGKITTSNSVAAVVAEVHHGDGTLRKKRVIAAGPEEQPRPHQRDAEAPPRASKKPRRCSSSSSSSSSWSSHQDDEEENLEESRARAEEYREHKRIQDALRADTMKVLMLLNAVRAAIHCKRGVQRLANSAAAIARSTATSFSGSAAACRPSPSLAPRLLPSDASAPGTNSSPLLSGAPASLPDYNDEEREREQFAGLLRELMEREMERTAITTNASAAQDPKAGADAGANALLAREKRGGRAAAAASRTTTTTTTTSSSSSSPRSMMMIPDNDVSSFSSSSSSSIADHSPGEDIARSDWFVGEDIIEN